MYVRPTSSVSSSPGGTEGPVIMAELASSLASNSSTQFRKARNRFVLINWRKESDGVGYESENGRTLGTESVAMSRNTCS
jgi:hypothetical protein